MTRKLLLLLAIVTVYPVANSFAATIPAGTTLTVTTVSLITSKDVVGRSFEAKIAQDVSIKGNVLLKAGTKAFGKIKSSRYNPRKNEPLTVELTSVSVNGRNVAVKTNSVEPSSPVRTARKAAGKALRHWLVSKLYFRSSCSQDGSH